jgi:hypothetical protein
MPDDAPKKFSRGYVSEYLRMPLRDLDEAQRDRESEPTANARGEERDKPKR